MATDYRHIHDPLCKHCGKEIAPKELRLWRWSGWSVIGGPGLASPPRPQGLKLDFYDFAFHKACYPKWIQNRDGQLQDLDRPVNSNKFFVRLGSSMFGHYVRDDKKHPCFAFWTEYDVLGQSLFLTLQEDMPLVPGVRIIVDDPKPSLLSFQKFLHQNGWLGQQWYEPRRPFVYLE